MQVYEELYQISILFMERKSSVTCPASPKESGSGTQVLNAFHFLLIEIVNQLIPFLQLFHMNSLSSTQQNHGLLQTKYLD